MLPFIKLLIADRSMTLRQSLPTDLTLTQSGRPASSALPGRALSSIKEGGDLGINFYKQVLHVSFTT